MSTQRDAFTAMTGLVIAVGATSLQWGPLAGAAVFGAILVLMSLTKLVVTTIARPTASPPERDDILKKMEPWKL